MPRKWNIANAHSAISELISFAACYGPLSPIWLRKLLWQLDHFLLVYVLCRNIVERRYDLSEGDASSKASFVLAGSVVLYPLVSAGLSADHSGSRSFIQIKYSVVSLSIV
jgi:hypothetical protein